MVGALEHVLDRLQVLRRASRGCASRRRSASSSSAGSFSRFSKRFSCSSSETCSQNLISTLPSLAERALELDDLAVGALPLLRAWRSSSTRSTSTRPYQERSNTAIPPSPGSAGQKRHRKWWRFSSGVGAANCATRTWRGSSGSTSRLIAPPLPGRVPALEDHASAGPEPRSRAASRRARAAARSSRVLRRLEPLRLLAPSRATATGRARLAGPRGSDLRELVELALDLVRARPGER